RRNGDGIVIVEEGAMPAGMRRGRRCAGAGRGLVALVGLRPRFGREARTRHGSRRHADQEGAASLVMLAHAFLLAFIVPAAGQIARAERGLIGGASSAAMSAYRRSEMPTTNFGVVSRHAPAMTGRAGLDC